MIWHENRVDADKWCLMILSFEEMYGLKEQKAVASKLGTIDEEHYRPLTKVDIHVSRSKCGSQGR